jgi:glutathione S-transferase
MTLPSHGREIVSQAFGILEKRMPAEGYAVGPQFSIADAALFYNEFWADKIGIPLPPRVAAHYQRVRARPVVRQVLAEEGYRSWRDWAGR